MGILLKKKLWQWVALFILAFIWGTSFILMKKGLDSFSSFQVASIRIFESFLFFFPFFLKNIKFINRQNIKSLLIVGFIGTAIPAFLFTVAETAIDSSLAGMLNSLTPLFTLIIGWILYKKSVTIISILGILLGLTGAIGLIYKSSGFINSIDFYSILVVLATMCYGLSVNEIKTNLKDLDGIKITMFGFLFTGPFAGIYLLFSELPDIAKDENLFLNLGFIIILALFSSVLALILFNNLIKHTPLLFSVSVTYLIPLFAIMWGVIDGEKINPFQLLWMGVILFGVFLVNKPEVKKKY